MKPARKDFVSIQGIVNGLVRTLAQRRKGPAADAERIWRTVVGDDLAGVSHVESVGADAVRVEVAGVAARAELEAFFRDRFLCALKDAGMTGVRRVQFHVADA
jgi:hypothetical protein